MEMRKRSISMASENRTYTVEDIIALPEGQRAELFDGEMVMMASPAVTHQSVLGWFFTEISIYIREKKGKCQVLPAPLAVLLKDDGKNYLEPDIVVICDEKKLDDRGCHGAPDWVIEIVSPSSRKLDYGRKLAAYMEAGVREYWIVDPEKQAIVVYYPSQPDLPAVYRFGDSVKTDVCEGLVIDSTPLGDIHYS